MTISLANVSFSYPGTSDFALDAVSVEFAPGELVLLTGPLGAGCSTLLLVAAGLAPHVTSGRRVGAVSTLGHDPAEPAARRALAGRIGLLLPTPGTQLSGMAPTVAEEIAFGPANLGWERTRIFEAAERAAQAAGVAHLLERDPRTLSGGELQRVMLAAVMAFEPDVYLLDEPALELDPAAATSVYDLLPTLACNATVIVASTDVDRLAGRADRVVLLNRGAIMGDGAPAAVLGTEAALDARCSTTVAEIARAAKAGSAPWPLSPEHLLRQVGA